MNVQRYVLVVFSFLVVISAEDRNHKKRQIYREEVLPHAGGKIPDTAFETDRLFLNRLQKEGISIPDGVVTEQRNPLVYPFYHKSPRTVFRIALTSDARYTPDVGKFNYKEVPTVETTYLYPQIHGQKVDLVPPSAAFPIYRQIQLHNPLLNQVKLQPKKKAQFLNVTPGGGKSRTKSYRTQSYQNFNLLNAPVTAPSAPKPLTNKFYLPNYDSSSYLFNEFDELFNNFDLESTDSFYDKSNSRRTEHAL